MNNLRKDDYCHICKEPLKDYPSNGEPLVHGVVCKACNFKLVLPIRWLLDDSLHVDYDRMLDDV